MGLSRETDESGLAAGSELRAGDLVLPAGTNVTPAIWLTNTRADIYPEPFAFRPERFLETSPGTYSWIPFAGGSRRCLGASFAEFEMRVVLSTVLPRYTLQAASRHPEHAARRNITLSPRHGTRIIVLSVPRPAPAYGPARAHPAFARLVASVCLGGRVRERQRREP